MKEKLQWTFVVVASVALGAAAVVGIDSLRAGDIPPIQEPATLNQPTPPPSQDNVSLIETPSDVADLFEQVRPSVVLISASNSSNGTGGIGSGIVIDKNGHILTNNHVIENFDQIDVTFADGTAASARVVGTDPGNDLAVIKVDLPAGQLVPAVLGESASVRVGEFVIAVGNPFGRTGTLTSGVVSGTGRTLGGGAGRPLRELIQSDAAINPGNSGGGLFNSRGEVIGITTAIENPSGDRVFAGIGFAVPIDTAIRFLPAMIAGDRIEHPRMGVGLRDLTPAVADDLGLPVDQGVIITQILPGSAADDAGLRGSRNGQGADLIIGIDAIEVTNFDDLASYVDSKNVGDTITVRIIRDGNEMTVQVTLEAWEPNTV